MNDLSIFEKIAPFLKDPLVLAGFVALVMATVFVTIIQSGAIPVLTKKAGGEILKRVILLTFIGLVIVVVSGISLTFYKFSKTIMTFDFTVFLENSNGESVVKGNGKLFLRIGNDKREETIDQKGCANFKQIPVAMRGKPANLQMKMADWQFENGKRTTEVLLKDNSAVVLVEPDNTLRFISGSVKDADGNYLPDVSVRCGDVIATTDTTGRFSLDIPVEKQKATQTLIAAKDGFESWEGFAYPAAKADISVVLQRKVK